MIASFFTHLGRYILMLKSMFHKPENFKMYWKEFMHQFQLMPDCDNLHVEIRLASREGEAFTEISLQAADLRKQPAVSLGSIFGFNIPMDIRVSFEKGPE